MVENFLLNIKPREYQKKIFEEIKDKNSLVILPTGVGKTLIALMLSIDRMQKFPAEKILFLAPTRPLAQQHLNYFKKHLPDLFGQMELFTGKIRAEKRKKIWERSDIIFSTPQCIANDLKNQLYSLNNVSLLIEDEVHRCVKNYSYTYVAKKYLESHSNKRVLGLTASPGTDKKSIEVICKNLSIEAVEVRTRDSDDVKEYLQKMNYKTIKIEFPKEFREIRELLKKMYDEKIESLKKKNVLVGPANKVTLLECQNKMMKSLATGSKNFGLFHLISTCAQALKVQHAIELIETQTIFTLSNYMDNLIDQADKNKSKAVKKLVTNPNFIMANTIVKELVSKNVEHPKLLKLKSVVENKIKKNKNAKIIVFTQYRDSVIKICKELNSISGVIAKVFVGQTKKNSKDKGLSQKEQQEIIKDFSDKKFNVLCATSIGEEGLDIPEVNAVIFYEPVPSAIRKIQRAGRTARLMPGELIMLITKGTRDEAFYWASISKEKKMHKAIDEIKENLTNNKLKPDKEDHEQKTLF
ncbi:MAG: DEAD/DEAH box helicase family protein [Candidatus Pacearchaeota archaeon]